MVVDNTVATGLLQRPLELGAVASVYSLTKSLSGHSDVIGGAVVSRDAGLLTALRDWRTAGGAIPGPFESWLVLRGLRTLPLRLERQSANAQAVAEFLIAHPRVRAVHYPGTTEATLDVARSQMPGGAGPLLSFERGPTAVREARPMRTRSWRRHGSSCPRPASAAWSQSGSGAPGGPGKPLPRH